MGWDKLKRFLQQAHTWTGQQTFTDINVTGGSISGAVSTELYTASTDPAVNAAVTTAIVDGYNGVVITLTGAGNAQILQSPTSTTVKRFIVFNNDTSGANTITVNGITLAAGKGQPFVWDGTAWGPTDIGITSIPVPAIEGGSGASTLTDHGVLLGSGTSAFTPMAVGATGEVIIGQTGSDPIWSSTATCNLTLPETGKITISPTLTTTDHTFQAVEAVVATAGITTEIGLEYYLKSDGKMWLADCSAASTVKGKFLATAVITANATGVFMKKGYFRDDSRFANMTVGGDLYTSTAGALTQTAPTPSVSTTVHLQAVGYVPSTNTVTVGIIWYDPDTVTYEVGVDIIDLGTATPTTILFSSMTSIPITWMANHSSDQTINFAAPVAADVGKMFRIVKNGTGAGKLILDAPSGVYLNSAAFASTDGGTAYLAASAYGSMTWMVTSATTLQLLHADGTVTFT